MNDPERTDRRDDLSSREDRQRELAALLALDAIDAAERAAAEDAVDPAQLIRFRQATTALADVMAIPAPAELRPLVLAAARAKRAPGVAVADPAPLGPADAFLRTVEALHRLLVDLAADEWAAPSLAAYGQTRDLIAHLVGVEESLLGLLGDGVPPDPVTWADHVEATSVLVVALRGTPTSILADRWVQAARRLAATAATVSPDAPIAVNDVRTTVRGMFVLRTFEVWTHHEDVCRATHRPLPVLDGSRLRLMSTELIAALPAALAVTASEQPGRTIRIVLTGPGGGTFERPMALDAELGVPDVVITADVVDFCRVASRRIAPRDLDATIVGDPVLAHVALQAASAFARD